MSEPIREYILERDTDEYSRPFLDYTFGKHPDWQCWAHEYEEQGRVGGRPPLWIPFIQFPKAPPGDLQPSLIVSGCEITISVGHWHCHRGIDCSTGVNIGMERLEEWNDLLDRIERGEVQRSQQARFIYDLALEALESLLNEQLVLLSEFRDGSYVAGGLVSVAESGVIASPGESKIGSCVYDQQKTEPGPGRVIKIASYRGTHDRSISV